MFRSFVLFAFLGVLLSTNYSKTESEAKELLPEFPEGDKNFNLSCLMFGHVGCDFDCIIVSKFYGYNSRGKCITIKTQKNICSCNNLDAPVNPHTTWRKKFDSDDIYNRVMMNIRTALEIAKILDDPRKTGEELKTLLRPILSPYQYSKLKVIDDSPAAKYIKNGELDRKSVQKFVSDQLDELLKDPWSRAQSLLFMNYRYSFKNALYSVRDRGTLYNFVYKATGLGNEGLKNIVDEFLRIYDFDKPALDEEEEPLVFNMVHYMIVNELIKRNEAKKKQIEAEKRQIQDKKNRVDIVDIEGIPDNTEKN